MATSAVLQSLPAPSSPSPAMPTAAPGDALHELRVRIPTDLHRQLLSLKVLRGKSLADTVSVALDLYFAEQARNQAPTADVAHA